VAPIDRLAAILRLDMPSAVSRSTSRILRMGNLAPDIGPLSPCGKGARPRRFADHLAVHVAFVPDIHITCSECPEQMLGIGRIDCSGSNRVRCSGSNRNRCSGSPGTRTVTWVSYQVSLGLTPKRLVNSTIRSSVNHAAAEALVYQR